MNPIVELAELCQKRFRANIETSVDGQYGEAHCPTIEVSITLPNGEVFKGIGDNQKEAKQAAAREALVRLRK